MWLQLIQNVFCWRCTRSSCSSTSCAGSWSGKEDRRADQYCVIMHCHFTRDIWCVSAICCFPFDSTQQRKLAFWIIPPTFLWFFFALFRFTVSILLFPHLSLFSLFLCRICYLCPFFIYFLYLFCSVFQLSQELVEWIVIGNHEKKRIAVTVFNWTVELVFCSKLPISSFLSVYCFTAV